MHNVYTTVLASARDDPYHLTMEVTKQNVAVLSNFEVCQLLKSVQESAKKKQSYGRSQNVATVSYEGLKLARDCEELNDATSDYLSRTPCAEQTPEIVKTFMKRMEAYKLTKVEKLQLLNLKPSTPVEIQLIIEEIEERFSEEEITELVEVIQTLL